VRQVKANAVTFFLILTGLKVRLKQLIYVCGIHTWPVVLHRDHVANFAALLLLFADNHSDFTVRVGVF
jgi:hypothetical protein